jgi:hypothetical protein
MASKEKKRLERRDDSSKSEMMQRFKTRPFIFIGTIFILVIVVIAFVFVPAMVPQPRGIGDFTFGYYNRVPIRMVSGNFFHQVQQQLSWQHQQQLSANPNNLGLVYNIWNQAFQETVVHMAIQDQMRRAGFVVPNNVVDREMARQFHVDGRFDAARYRAMNSADRMNLWRQIQEGLTVQRYLSDLGGLRLPPNEVEFIRSMASPRRSFSVAIFPLDSFPDAQVVAHAQANPDPFRITHLSRITMNSERDARQLLAQVREGTITFEEAARNHSQDFFAEQGGDMGMRMAHELAGEIWNLQARENVINLARGELSDVVSVSLGWGASGWAFFRAEEAVLPPDTGDPLQLERIRSHIMANFRGMVEDWVVTEAERFSDAVRERGFDLAAAEGNIARGNFGPIPVNFGDSILFRAIGRTPDVPELQGAGRDLFFWRAAFSTPLMTPSVPIVLWDNVMVLFPLEESYEDEDFLQAIESFYASVVMDYLDWGHRSYFLNSDRLDNRFDDTFWRLWGFN